MNNAEQLDIFGGSTPLKDIAQPPQSWCYVEELSE